MKNMKKKLVSLIVGASLICSFAGSSLAADKTLTIGIAKEPAKLNPVLIPGVFGEAVAGSIFDTLVSFKEDASNPAPALAESWTISEDGTIYTFKLRKGVKFHNGADFTAKDVKYTIEAVKNPDNASPSKEFLDPIASVEILDDYTVKLTLNAPYAPLMLALGSATLGILPADYAAELGMDDFDRKPVGTGPYKFVEWLPDEQIVLAKNGDYFLTTPALDKVVYRPIPKPEVMAAEVESGGVDIAHRLLPQDVERLSSSDRVNVMTIPGLSNSYMGFSYTKAPFSDLRFRQAVYHAVPFEPAIKGIWKGVGERSYSWIPTGVFPNDTDYMKSKALAFDPKKAEGMFNELKAEGVIPEDFEFSIYTSQNPFRVKIATAVATELRKYGLKAKVESLEWGTLFPILKADSGCYIMGWGSVPDPDRWTYKIFHTGSTMNFSMYSKPEIDKALELGRTLVGSEARGEQYKKVMRTALTEDYIHIPLVFKSVTAVAGKNVKDFAPSPQDYFHLVTEKRNVTVE